MHQLKKLKGTNKIQWQWWGINRKGKTRKSKAGNLEKINKIDRLQTPLIKKKAFWKHIINIRNEIKDIFWDHELIKKCYK